jgi:hypothetical protein
VGDIGLIIRPTDDKRLTFEAGVQGYLGVIEGISGGLRLGYEF